jgi:hypothetical protein
MTRYQLLLGLLLAQFMAVGLSCAAVGPAILDESSLQRLKGLKKIGLKWNSGSDAFLPLELTRYVLNKQGIDVFTIEKENPEFDAILIIDDLSSSNQSEPADRQFMESFESVSRRHKYLQDYPPKITYKTSLTLKIEGHKVYKREFKYKRVQLEKSESNSTQELVVYCLMDVITQVKGISAVLDYLESDSTPVWRGAGEYLAEENNVFRTAADNALPVMSASLHLFDDSAADRRVLAARILGRFDDSIAVTKLVNGLTDKEYTVQRACRESLTRITSQDFGYDISRWMDYLETRTKQKTYRKR